MTTPSLSAPTPYSPQILRKDPILVTQIVNLVNDAFARSKLPDPMKWGQKPRSRFPDNEVYFEMLGQEGVVAAIFDNIEEEKKLVAVAAAVPWQGGWKKEGAGVEEGWEIKAVAVDGDAKYLRRGLATQLYTFLEQQLISRTKTSGRSTTGRRLADADRLTLWILAAECINGPYWRKRGYYLVRKDICEAPTWGCETSFEMIVLRKDIPLDSSHPQCGIESEQSVDGSATRKTLEVN
ncbi:hypothetical protein N0V94_000188 [Neodidymelliopsis sp. IMI 364377]|nr:hypothetical protein N0V94_000188 [Neodidymelliopsis sp. IMI 364377]